MNTKEIALPGKQQGNKGETETVINNSTEQQKKTDAEVLAENIITSCSIQKMKFFSENAIEREWLINGIIPAGQVMLLAGLGGAGKSTMALQFLLNLLINRTGVFGSNDNTKNSKYIYVTAEDDIVEIHTRLRDIALYYVEIGIATESQILNLEADNRLIVLTDDNIPKGYENLLTVKTQKNIVATTIHFETLKKVVEITRPRLIVLDALTSLFSCDFSNMADAQHVMRLCKELTAYGSSVLILHHMTKTAYNPTNFDSLLAAVFGSIGTLNKLRHLLILWKNNLFIGKSNLIQRYGWKLKQNGRVFDFEAAILSDASFDEIVKKENGNNGNNEIKTQKNEEEVNLIPTRGRKRRVPNYGL